MIVEGDCVIVEVSRSRQGDVTLVRLSADLIEGEVGRSWSILERPGDGILRIREVSETDVELESDVEGEAPVELRIQGFLGEETRCTLRVML